MSPGLISKVGSPGSCSILFAIWGPNLLGGPGSSEPFEQYFFDVLRFVTIPPALPHPGCGVAPRGLRKFRVAYRATVSYDMFERSCLASFLETKGGGTIGRDTSIKLPCMILFEGHFLSIGAHLQSDLQGHGFRVAI